jgi:hypothetical protein
MGYGRYVVWRWGYALKRHVLRGRERGEVSAELYLKHPPSGVRDDKLVQECVHKVRHLIGLLRREEATVRPITPLSQVNPQIVIQILCS